ncbi:hypothetical protein K1T71_006373 [Dendrolimus kikuchii]|uniref:Uncharacterized protein n=1 Tax=Dendrolimus kikuchii TaxID=765133 RepID=A0ACC1D445_9NEOP|nr:hypothetical protein K1T71_006373 [Dendrolimus kikuchii]
MNMLRWMCGVTRKDRVRNSRIRGSLHVRDIADKLQECRLRCYGHVLRRPANYVGNKCLAMPPPPGPGRRGRGDTEDRAKWSRKSRKADPGRWSERSERNRELTLG